MLKGTNRMHAQTRGVPGFGETGKESRRATKEHAGIAFHGISMGLIRCRHRNSRMQWLRFVGNKRASSEWNFHYDNAPIAQGAHEHEVEKYNLPLVR